MRYDYINSDENNWNRLPTSAEGNQSFAAGGSCHAYGDWSFAAGKDTRSYQRADFAIGGGSIAGRTEEAFNKYYWDYDLNKPKNNGKGTSSNNILDENSSSYSNQFHYGLAFGDSTQALGRSSIATGLGSVANGRGSFSCGWNNTTDGEFSFAIGSSNQTIGNRALVVGYQNKGGTDSFAGGYLSKALSDYSFAFGASCESSNLATFSIGRSAKASGRFSVAIGEYVNSKKDNQIVLGVLNKDNSNALVIFGNGYWGDAAIGTTTTRQNAFEIKRIGGFTSYGDSQILGKLTTENLQSTSVAVDDIITVNGTITAGEKIQSHSDIEAFSQNSYDLEKLISQTNSIVKEAPSTLPKLSISEKYNYVSGGIDADGFIMQLPLIENSVQLSSYTDAFISKDFDIYLEDLRLDGLLITHDTTGGPDDEAYTMATVFIKLKYQKESKTLTLYVDKIGTQDYNSNKFQSLSLREDIDYSIQNYNDLLISKDLLADYLTFNYPMIAINKESKQIIIKNIEANGYFNTILKY